LACPRVLPIGSESEESRENQQRPGTLFLSLHPCAMMLHFTRAPIIVLTLEFKKCFIKHQKSTVRFIVMAAQESVIFIHVPKAAGTTLNRLIEWEHPLFEM
jgi:hypothetical protein